ncbi:glycosyltransferase family 39 protein [Rhodoferax sp.]|uniref:ArnT family glycosyltransferase n=1 Tax=Rhodoferax sp. TaxID=50421 RepID=UPI0025F680A4|nr:glycosyltransferase family 39 protein [Rhodoferax sp.]
MQFLFPPSKHTSAHRLLWLVFLLHAVWGAVLGLSVDEAHYLLYAAHPALSYFDHPPLVGWVQIPLVALDAPVAVLRLVPGLCWLLTVWGVHRLTLRLWAGHGSADRAALAAVLALALAPLVHVLGIGLLPDTLLMLLTVALMHQTWTLMQAGAMGRSAPWWVMGVLLGLAGLAKYTAVFTAFAIGFCVVRAQGLRVLRLPALWGGMAIAAVLISPVLVWNAQNDWSSFAYQLAHGKGSVWQAEHVLRFVLTQLVVFGPLFGWAVAGWRTASRDLRSLAALFAVPFAIFTYMAGGGTALPHWTAPAWVALAPFAGMGLALAWRHGARRTVAGLAVLQGVVCLALLGLMGTAGWPLVPRSDAAVAPQPNPFADLHGWDTAGDRARALAAQQGLPRVAVQNWTLGSRLGWYARPLPLFVLAEGESQFPLWSGSLPPGEGVLLVDWSHMAYEPPVGAHGFASCALLDDLPVAHLGMPLARFRFYDCRGWAGATPQPRLTLAPTVSD